MNKILITLFLVTSLVINAQDNAINRAMNRYDYKEALKHLSSEKPSLNNDLLKVQCYKNLMEYDKAINILENQLKSDTLQLQVLNGLTELYQATGKYHKANMIYKRLLQIQPDNRFFALGNTGNLYKMKEWSQALTEIKKGLMSDSLPQLLSLAGDCYWQLDKNDSAIYFYRMTLKQSPDDYNTISKLARIYLQTQKYEELTACTNDYIQIDSTNNTINQYNGIGYCFLQQFDSSIYRLKKLYDQGDKTFTTNFYLGSSYYGLQDYYSADDHLSEAYKKDSTNLNLIFYLGRSATLIGKFAKGTALLERGLQIMTPKDTVLYNYYQNLATAYSRWKKPTLAIDYYTKCLKIMPDNKMTVYKMASIFDYELKNRKQALFYYKMFMSFFPKEPETKNENPEIEIKGTYYSAVKNRLEEIKNEEFFNKK